jgi:hypothetical protein
LLPLACGPAIGQSGESGSSTTAAVEDSSTSTSTAAGETTTTSADVTSSVTSSTSSAGSSSDDGSDSIQEADVGVPMLDECTTNEEVCFVSETLLEGRFGLVSTTGDVDDDGLADIVVWSKIDDGSENGLPDLMTMPGTGSRVFGAEITSAWDAGDVVAMTMVDVDGDGALDLVGNDPYLPGLWVAQGDGTGGFGDAIAWVLPDNAGQLANADIDGDGIDEVVSTMAPGTSELAILSGLDPSNPTITFRETGINLRGVAVGDLGLGSAAVDLVVMGHVGRQWRVRVSDALDAWTTILVWDDGLDSVHAFEATADAMDDLLVFHHSTLEVHARTGPATFDMPVIESDAPDLGATSVLFGAFVARAGTNIAVVGGSAISLRDFEDFPWDDVEIPHVFAANASAADLDADGRDDIAVPDSGRNELIVLWNGR